MVTSNSVSSSVAASMNAAGPPPMIATDFFFVTFIGIKLIIITEQALKNVRSDHEQQRQKQEKQGLSACRAGRAGVQRGRLFSAPGKVDRRCAGRIAYPDLYFR